MRIPAAERGEAFRFSDLEITRVPPEELTVKPGVHRHRSIEDLIATVGQWEQEHVDAHVRTIGHAGAIP